MRENQICYFIDYGFNRDMHISYGVYEYEKMYGGHVVSQLKAPEIRLINGIPFDEFQSETEFKKVPKGWTYNTEMFTVTEDVKKKEKILAETKGKFNIKSPSDLQWLFDNEYLVKKQDVEPVIEVEYNHNTYRIVKKYPSWTISYGKHNNRYPDEVFETWEEAEERMNEIKKINHRKAVECALLDFYEDLEWTLEKYEAEHGGREIETIRQKILAKPHLDDIMFRYYKGEILIVSREAHRKDNHIKWEKIA